LEHGYSDGKIRQFKIFQYLVLTGDSSGRNRPFMSENERIAKQMLAVTKAAAQSPNPKYRAAALRWKKLIERQLGRDQKNEGAEA